MLWRGVDNAVVVVDSACIQGSDSLDLLIIYFFKIHWLRHHDHSISAIIPCSKTMLSIIVIARGISIFSFILVVFILWAIIHSSLWDLRLLYPTQCCVPHGLPTVSSHIQATPYWKST